MKQTLPLAGALLIALSATAQRVYQPAELVHPSRLIDLTEGHFVKQYPESRIPAEMLRSGSVSFVELGSAPNVYGSLIEETNQVDYNPQTNSVAFVHRLQAVSGTISMDYSNDGGASWSTNSVLTPDFSAGSSPVGGNRYPNLTIWNPSGNTSPANAYTVAKGPALQAGGAGWGWVFSASARLSDGGNVAEDYYQRAPGANLEFFPMGLSTTPDGTVWSIHTRFNETNDDYTEFYINKGTFNTSTNQVDWVLFDTTIDPDMSFGASGASAGASAWNLAFSPDGQTGYAVMVTHTNTSPYAGYQPVVYKSTDAGATWNQLPQFDFKNMPSSPFTPWLIPTVSGEIVPNFTAADITVDANGRMHMFSNVRSHYSDDVDSLGFIWVNSPDGAVFHLSTSTGADWDIDLIDSITTDRGTLGTVSLYYNTNISRSADGEKIFFSWNATDPAILTTHDLPNLRIRGYDVNSDEYTFMREATAGTALDGSAFYVRASPTVMESGSSRDYEIPVVFLQPGLSDVDPANFYYIRGAGFDEDEFGLLAPNATADFSFVVNLNTVSFTNLSLDATSYVWDFGDGGPLSSLTNPSRTYSAIGTYEVCLTARNAGSPTTDGTTCKNVEVTELASGIQDQLLDKAVSLFPSPSAGLVNLSLEGQPFGELNVSVYNLLGELVLPAQIMPAGMQANLQLDLSDLPNGQYLVKVQTDNAVATRSVVVSR